MKVRHRGCPMTLADFIGPGLVYAGIMLAICALMIPADPPGRRSDPDPEPPLGNEDPDKLIPAPAPTPRKTAAPVTLRKS